MPPITPVPLAFCTALTFAGALLVAAPGASADSHGHHGSNASAAAAPGDMQAAMTPSMDGMMSFEPSGNPDVDFATLMIPHHEGAIAMAQSLLETSKDPTLRAMAEDIVAGQEREIATLRAWLRDRGR